MPTKIPHPERRFLIGNLHQIQGEDIIGKLIEVTQDYRPIVELSVLGITLTFINDVDLAKETFDERYYDKFIDKPIEHLRALAGDGLFTAYTDEPNWKKAHNILLPGFGHQAIAGYVPIMLDTIDELITKWKGQLNQDIDVNADMTRLTFETIGRCGFDYSFDCFKSEEQHEFIDAMLFALDECVQRARTAPFMLPFRFKRNATFRKHVSYMNNLLDTIIQKRRANPEQYKDKIDFLNLMLHSKDKDSGELLDDENIRHQIVTFLVAGHETTSALLSFALYNLCAHPEALDKAYAEVDTFFGDNPNKTIGHKDFRAFEFLHQVLMESLRLYPPISLFTRCSKEDTFIGKEQYPIKKNTSIIIMPYHMHRDKKHWGENPEVFNPSNFTREAIRKRDNDAFKAFGHGARNCIGQHFAMLEAVLALVKVLQTFKISMDPNYQLQYAPNVTLKPDGLKMQVKLR